MQVRHNEFFLFFSVSTQISNFPEPGDLQKVQFNDILTL